MPARRLSIRKIKEVLRLRYGLGLTQEQIGRSCNITQPTVHRYLERAAAAGLSWPLPTGIDDRQLETQLFPTSPGREPQTIRPMPDLAAIHQQLQANKHVTLQLLWEEYREAHPNGYSYSRLCELYEIWRRQQNVVLRQEHRAGEKTFVDWAGPTIPVYDRDTGDCHPASLFVAVLGASSYTFAYATPSQEMPHWISCHVRAFEFFGGSTKLIIPDNTRTGVIRACRYEPDVNRTYHEMAPHSGVAVMPARPYKPRDKTCASYCTLSGFDSGQDGLGGAAAAMPFHDCDISERLIQRMAAAIADNTPHETAPRPFMDGGFGNSQRLSHLFPGQ